MQVKTEIGNQKSVSKTKNAKLKTRTGGSPWLYSSARNVERPRKAAVNPENAPPVKLLTASRRRSSWRYSFQFTVFSSQFASKKLRHGGNPTRTAPAVFHGLYLPALSLSKSKP
jgi:hypothetical protein